MEAFPILAILVGISLFVGMAERKLSVQVLRRGARNHQVERVADNAGRDRVKGMAVALLDHAELVGEEREEMEEAWKNYQDSWPDWALVAEADNDEASGGEAANVEDGKQAWFFKAAQLTFNKKDGEWSSTDQATLSLLFERFKVWLVTALNSFRPLGISATMERSTATDTHVHLHAYFHLSDSFRSRGQEALAPFVFEGIRPHIETNTARGPAYSAAVNRGHYYVFIKKIGSLFEWTNFPPFQSYGPEAWWIDNWYKQGKLANNVYLDIAARIGVGFQRRLADLKAAERYMREAAVKEHIEREQSQLSREMMDFKQYVEVDHFLSLFSTNVRKHRRPILALIGGTNLGKSMLAADILKRVGDAKFHRRPFKGLIRE